MGFRVWGLGFRVWGLGLRVPKIRGTLLGVPRMRTIVFWGLYWGPLILGNYHLWIAVLGLRFRVSGVGFGVYGLGFGVQGLGFKV